MAEDFELNFDFGGAGDRNLDKLGMREMQRRAYAKRDVPYLLIKAPPASGKSRAMMYLSLYKLHHQGINKVIVAVPQRMIGSSFMDTNLTSGGFECDWHVLKKYYLVTKDNNAQGKASIVLDFLRDKKAKSSCLVCTHATLVKAMALIRQDDLWSLLDRTVVGVDEFHHAATDDFTDSDLLDSDSNRLGQVVSDIMSRTAAHIVAMTGSYFRGDGKQILNEQDEARFSQVVYTYYEQLASYQYLKSLNFRYAFYNDLWTKALYDEDVIDSDKKTIVYIPFVNSRDSTGDKLNEAHEVIHYLGERVSCDEKTGLTLVRSRKSKRLLKVANLVLDTDIKLREQLNITLQNARSRDDVDVIVALGMAKEGFDWPWCEETVVIGYRHSLTEQIQILGRCTRDCVGKESVTYVNLLAKPDANKEDVEGAINALLKALTFSLLMEQVLRPNIHFRLKSDPAPLQDNKPVITLDDSHFPYPATERFKETLESLDAYTEKILKDNSVIERGILGCITNEDLSDIIAQSFKVQGFADHEAQMLGKAVVYNLNKQQLLSQVPSVDSGDYADRVLSESGETSIGASSLAASAQGLSSQQDLDQRLLKDRYRYICVDEVEMNLIMQERPFKGAYEFVSMNLNEQVLRKIKERIQIYRFNLKEEEIYPYYCSLMRFYNERGRMPEQNSSDSYEEYLYYVSAFIAEKVQSFRDQKAAKE